MLVIEITWKLKHLKFILVPFPVQFTFVPLTWRISCNSSKKRKEYLVLTCGPPSINTSVPEGKGEDGESSFDEDSSGDEENQTVSFPKCICFISCYLQWRFYIFIIILCVEQVSISDRHRPRKKQRITKKGKGREWILKKKEQMRRKGNVVPPDTKYTARKRKSRFWCCTRPKLYLLGMTGLVAFSQILTITSFYIDHSGFERNLRDLV